MRIAVLDLGATTFHLEHFDFAVGGSSSRSLDAKRYLRLGAQMVARARFDGATRARMFAVVAELLELSRAARPDRIAVVATSPFRDADNGRVVADALGAGVGASIRILSPQDEARFAYLGNAGRADDLGRRRLVVDLGGGSAELAVGQGPSCSEIVSLPLGAVRLSCSQVPGPGLWQSLTEAFSEPTRAVAALRPQELVFASGTARAARKLAMRESRDPGGVGPMALSDLERCLREHAGKTPEEMVAMGVDAARADTVLVAVCTLGALSQLSGVPQFYVSDRGLRDGVALEEFSIAMRAERREVTALRPVARVGTEPIESVRAGLTR